MHEIELWTPASPAPDSAGGTQTQAAPEDLNDPALAELQAAVAKFMRESRAATTRKAYTSDWNTFTAWCDAHGQQALPASVGTLAMYLANLVDLGRKYGSIKRARTAIGQVHAAAGLSRPDRDPGIRLLERGIGRSIGTREKGAPPLCIDELARAVGTLRDSTRDVRDRALLLLGFAGGYRASDLVGLDVEHIRLDGAALRVFHPRGKEDQLGRGRTMHVAPAKNADLCPVRAVQRWIEHAALRTGPLFRVISGAQIRPARIHPRAVTRAVQRATKRAGLSAGYSSHSLRAGLATSADARGSSLLAIQQHVGWRDARTPARYIDPCRGGTRSVLVGLL